MGYSNRKVGFEDLKIMKLFTCATLAFAAVSAQAEYSDDSGAAYDYGDDYSYDYYGNSTNIDERGRSAAEKEAAKANRQKNKNKNKKPKYTTPPPTTTTEEPTTTPIYTTTTTEKTTSTTVKTTTTTKVDDYTTEAYDTTEAYETNPPNKYAGQGGAAGSYDQYATTTTEVADVIMETTKVGVITLDPITTETPELLVCWTCHAKDPEECMANGESVTCLENQEACQLEVRTREQEDGTYAFVEYRTGCKQKRACRNNQKQNFVGGNKDYTQCRPEEDQGYDHSVCRQCCYEDNCVSDGSTFWMPEKRSEWKKNMAQQGGNGGGNNPYGGGVDRPTGVPPVEETTVYRK